MRSSLAPAGPWVTPLSRRSWMFGAAAGALAAQPAGGPVRLPRKVRLALIGLDGHPGEILNQLPRLPDVELAAVCDPSPAVLARAAKKWPSARRYADYRRMLESEQLDLAAVCNTNGARAAAVLACVERRLHVIAEKPLAIKRQDLASIRKAVAKQDVRLSMLLPMRFSPSYLALKKVVQDGEIGEVVQIAAQKSYKSASQPDWRRHRESYGGTIPWIGIHMVDLMRWSSSREFTEVFSLNNHIGFPELGDMENTTASVFGLDNGGMATLHMDYLRPETAPTHGDDRLRLAGTKGVAEYQAATGVTLVTEKTPPRTIKDLPPPQSVFVDFLESVYSGKPASLSLDDIYRVNEIVLIAQEAAEQHRIARL